jgi:hypothetical protein
MLRRNANNPAAPGVDPARSGVDLRFSENDEDFIELLGGVGFPNSPINLLPDR